MKGRQVLIVSNPDDMHVRKVAAAIADFGAIPILFFPEDLGQPDLLSMSFSSAEQATTLSLSVKWTQLDLENIYSVWYRRPRLVSLDKYGLSREGLEFSRDEWRAALEAVYVHMQRSLWVSHPDKLREAARKPFQLSLARTLGFAIPRTLIANNPCQAKEFFLSCEGKMIAKPIGAAWVYGTNESDVTYILTNRINAETIEESERISISPIIFQEEVPKAYEIRANIVGQQVIAIKIDSQKSEISQLDWRRYDVERTPYTSYQLPWSVQRKCLKLAQLLGLEFGAIDLIRRPDGEYVFLEINGNGQFLWAEELSGAEISAAIAGLLSGVTPPLRLMDLA